MNNENENENEISPLTNSINSLSIFLTGSIEYEWCLELKTQLKHLQKNHPQTLIILDLKELDFIGSSSILHFVEAIKQLHKEGVNLKLVNVQMEFIKVFQLYQLYEVEISSIPSEKLTPINQSSNPES